MIYMCNYVAGQSGVCIIDDQVCIIDDQVCIIDDQVCIIDDQVCIIDDQVFVSLMIRCVSLMVRCLHHRDAHMIVWMYSKFMKVGYCTRLYHLEYGGS